MFQTIVFAIICTAIFFSKHRSPLCALAANFAAFFILDFFSAKIGVYYYAISIMIDALSLVALIYLRAKFFVVGCLLAAIVLNGLSYIEYITEFYYIYNSYSFISYVLELLLIMWVIRQMRGGDGILLHNSYYSPASHCD